MPPIAVAVAARVSAWSRSRRAPRDGFGEQSPPDRPTATGLSPQSAAPVPPWHESGIPVVQSPEKSVDSVPIIPLIPSKPPRLPFPILFSPLPSSARNLPVAPRVSTWFPVFLLTSTFLLLPTSAPACGLDWTLPTNHFDGVNEQGYVSYWEKIADADLGDGLVIPLNINFNSHRETSSPTLGKGWMVALLESHVEPIDENAMKVIMPDGWNFYFLRTANTENWGGNAGWIGQTDGSRFTITAPCGWRVKFDSGKIQEIDSPQGRTISYKYNGPVATEVDIDNKPFVQVESNPATGVAQDLLIAGQKITIAQDQRPRIQSVNNQNLITGFDPCLSQLQYPNGKTETFSFATPKDLTPTLAITNSDQTHRSFIWDASTRQIKTDGVWAYTLSHEPSDVLISRTNASGQRETYANDAADGKLTVLDIDGAKTITSRFVNAGPLTGRIRKIEKITGRTTQIVYLASYDSDGSLIREIRQDIDLRYSHSQLVSIWKGGVELYRVQYNN